MQDYGECEKRFMWAAMISVSICWPVKRNFAGKYFYPRRFGGISYGRSGKRCVEHSGIPMDQCYGLTVHDVENTWRSYTTIWEDAVAHGAEVELSNTLPETKEREETAQEAQIKRR